MDRSYVPLGAILFATVAFKLHTIHSFPRVGNQIPFGVGYLIAAFKGLTQTSELIQEGIEKYSGKPFVLPTLAGSILCTTNKADAQLFKKSDDSVWNQPMSANERLQMDYTMNEFQQRMPYQAAVTRSDITKQIGNFIPGMVEEIQLSTEETLCPNGTTTTQVTLFETVVHLVARISNRSMVGTSLCRDKEYINTMVHYAETLVPFALLLQWVPRATRGILYWFLSGEKRRLLRVIASNLKKRLEERQSGLAKPACVAELLIDAAPQREIDDLQLLAMRVLNLNFASIHTSSIFVAHALLELACLPQQDIKKIREEIVTALEEEGGWNKPALARLWSLDSILREVGRMYGFGQFLEGRLTVKEGVLSDGTRVPPGWHIAFVLRSIHRDPAVFTDPEVFDAFRFSKLRQEEESAVRYGFTTLDAGFLLFGVGRHACPGRFFAAAQLKILLAHILLNWDISLPEGVKEKPKNLCYVANVLPSPTAKLVFTKRMA